MATIELSQSDDGRTVPARPGDEIVFVLPENATTGYRWHLDVADGILSLLSDGYREAVETNEAEVQIGRGGLREFRFRVTSHGTARVTLKRWQEWEDESTADMRVALQIASSPDIPADISSVTP
jgi:inhibitor of cysteine peptidase